MPTHTSPGLPVTWLNAWLAAIGVTVLLPETRLSWTTEPVPIATFHCDHDDLAQAIHDALPDRVTLEQLAIARHLGGADEFKRNVTLPAYLSRVELERRNALPSLAITVTDLKALKDGDELPHSPFDVTVPKGLTLWQRVLACHDRLGDVAEIRRTLQGNPQRVKANGLGFDIRRLPSRADGGDNYIDPVVELLAFVGLTLFPIRGDGRRPTTRGWTAPPTRRAAFRWAAWTAPLDRWGIDAWLDQFHHDRIRDAHAVHTSVPYRPAGSSDTTRGYAAEAAK